MSQEIFNSTNKLMSHQFVQNKFVQEFMTISLLIKYIQFKINYYIIITKNFSLNVIPKENGLCQDIQGALRASLSLICFFYFTLICSKKD